MLPRVEIEGTLQLPDEGISILQTLFAGYRRVIVKQEFTGNYSGSRVFLVQPIRERGTECPAVVKFAARSLIEKEWRAYQQMQRMCYGMVQVRDKALPVYGDWGALSYPLQGGGTFKIENLDAYYHNHPMDEVLSAFRRVFKTLDNIHNQSHAAPGFFWRASYDRLLPVNLFIAAGIPPTGAPIHILDATQASTFNGQPGDWVQVHGFAVTKVDLRDRTVTLNLPDHQEHPDSFCVRFSMADSPDAYHEQQIAPPLTGQIKATRQSQLRAYVQSLVKADAVDATMTLFYVDGMSLPNPCLHLSSLLNRYSNVRTSLIHGDLNLYNILVDSDTGYISLIDIAEAREDHILHDFLRMETEVVTKLLPNILAAQALSTAQMMFEFYQALHCATFESPAPHDYRIPSALEKPFEVIQIIRRAASRHFYTDNPTEYYQGLWLYLVGALKFSNLDHHPAAPLPKQAALWSAATVARLLEAAPVCQPRNIPIPRTSPPEAWLVDYAPEVKILRKGSECFTPASHGIPLYQGDTISTFTKAKALVQCQNGPLFTIPDERNQRVDCAIIPAERVHARLNLYDTARLPYLINHFLTNIKLPPAAPAPLLLMPRQTRLHHARPTFHWQAVVGATGYRLSIRMPGGVTWQREVSSTTLPYPDDVPPLAPGSGNTAILEILDMPHSPDVAYLEMLSADELDILQAQEKAIRDLNLSTVAEHYLLTLLYQKWKLWDAAIQQLEYLTHTASISSSALWLHLGELCLRTGLYPQAESHYLQALAAGEIERGALAQITARVGLACAAYAQSHHSQTLEYLTASGEYAAFMQYMRSQLEIALHTKRPTLMGAVNLFSYVRSLAEHIAVHLAEEIHQIPDRFLEQLQGMSQYTLRPATGAWSTLGAEKFAAPEILAATYITTRTLVGTYSRLELEQQAHNRQLGPTLENHARKVAQTMLGLSVQQADDFAKRYAELVMSNLDVLQQLLEAEKS